MKEVESDVMEEYTEVEEVVVEEAKVMERWRWKRR